MPIVIRDVRLSGDMRPSVRARLCEDRRLAELSCKVSQLLKDASSPLSRANARTRGLQESENKEPTYQGGQETRNDEPPDHKPGTPLVLVDELFARAAPTNGPWTLIAAASL
jgi:hypothetical protein